MLCLPCHGQVHGRTFATNHAELTRAGLAAAKRRGVKLGNPALRAGDATALRTANEKRRIGAKRYAADVLPFIDAARRAGCTSLGQIAAALTARGIRTPAGAMQWNHVQVRRVIRSESA